MNKIILTLSLLVLMNCNSKKQQETISLNKQPITTMQKQNIYSFQVNDLYGKQFDFATLKGKKILIVNTASECGLTPQYEGLQRLYTSYNNKNLVIVGFPANNFGKQEPGTNSEIATFCKQNYGVSFPMMSKISVKGDDIHPIYEFLTQKSKNEFQDSEVTWNFQKYLINENGELEKVISPKVEPLDKEIVDWIEGK